MDQQTLLIIMTAFVMIAAIALLIQAGLLFAIVVSVAMAAICAFG